MPVIGKMIRISGNLYTRYLIHGKTIPNPHILKESGHIHHAPHTVIDHNNAIQLIRNEKDLCVIDCMCRTISRKCDSPLKTCILVGKEARERNRKHPEQAISTHQAIQILEFAFEHHLIHNAIYVMGNLVELCNCCRCCCLPMIGVQKGFKSLRPSHYKAVRSDERCEKCGKCEDICPFQAIINERITEEKCFGCGLCAHECSEGAIHMVERRPEANGNRYE